MITRFLDSETTSDHDRFQAWRTEHQDGTVLMLEPGSRARLHGARCLHFGSGPPYFASGDGFGSLTSKQKLCGLESELIEWAAQNGVAIKSCQHCFRDGLIGTIDIEPELERQIAEAEEVLTRVVPDREGRTLVLKRLVESARVADTISPNAWGATLFSDGFRLNVGQVEVLVLGPYNRAQRSSARPLRVNLLAELGAPPFVGPRFVPTTYSSMPEPQCAFVGTIAEYAEVEAAIVGAHEAFVRRAASTRSGDARVGTPFRRSHNEGLLEFARRASDFERPTDIENQIDHYVAYHSVDLMEREYGGSGDDFGHYSRKPESVLRKTIGNLVWVIVGKRGDKQTRYRLAGVYSPDRLTDEEGDWLVQGRGIRVGGHTNITDLPWFIELLREQNRFSLGMNRIRSLQVVEALTSLIPDCIRLGSASPTRPSGVEPEAKKLDEPSFTYAEAFPVIASVILAGTQSQPQRFLPHDAIVDLILADRRGADMVAQARLRSAWADDREAASNMVAWFSQQISVGRSEWLQVFERQRIDGAWAYRPAALPRIGQSSDADIAVTEGEPRMSFHIRREREPRIVAAKRLASRNGRGELECEACGFVAQHSYSGFSGDVAEVHHRRPLAEATGPVETTLDDLAILCANCHRAIHQTRPMLTVDEFRERFLNSR